MRVNFNQSQPVVNTEKKIHNVLILDSSGSMSGSKWNAAIEFANGDLAINKQGTVDIENSVVTFSSYVKESTIWKASTPQKLDSRAEFIGQSTALTDAIGQTLTRLLKEVTGDQVLVKIFTDGEENCSLKFSRFEVRELIQRCEKYGWTITFAGTEHDVKQAQKLYGIDASNTIIHENTAESIKSMANIYRGATQIMAEDYAAGKNVSRGFFKQINKTDDEN